MKHTLYPLLVFVFVLSACASPAASTEVPVFVDPAGSTMPALTDPSLPIVVNSSDVFMIVVESNPSTGYHWEVLGELNGVELISREYTASEPVLPGSSGVDVWAFKAVNAGETQITLGYYPPSNDPTEPDRTVTFNVVLK